eukprot:scaffold2584_cov53-Attheya_sp.AAC.5
MSTLVFILDGWRLKYVIYCTFIDGWLLRRRLWQRRGHGGTAGRGRRGIGRICAPICGCMSIARIAGQPAPDSSDS